MTPKPTPVVAQLSLVAKVEKVARSSSEEDKEDEPQELININNDKTEDVVTKTLELVKQKTSPPEPTTEEKTKQAVAQMKN